MSRLVRFLVAAILVVVLVWLIFFVFGGRARSAPPPPRSLSTGAGMDLSGIVLPFRWMTEIDRRDREHRWFAEVSARVAAERAARARRATPSSSRRAYSGGAVTGSCAAMAPAGFPGYIVERESGGNPNAVNASSGAQGCAQILPSHFRSTCSGMTYAQCWAALWDNGNGASHWAYNG